MRAVDHVDRAIGILRASDADRPTSVKYKGEEYWSTGKTGKHIATGTPSAEYKYSGTESKPTDKRAWRRDTGEIDPD